MQETGFWFPDLVGVALALCTSELLLKESADTCRLFDRTALETESELEQQMALGQIECLI